MPMHMATKRGQSGFESQSNLALIQRRRRAQLFADVLHCDSPAPHMQLPCDFFHVAPMLVEVVTTPKPQNLECYQPHIVEKLSAIWIAHKRSISVSARW